MRAALRSVLLLCLAVRGARSALLPGAPCIRELFVKGSRPDCIALEQGIQVERAVVLRAGRERRVVVRRVDTKSICVAVPRGPVVVRVYVQGCGARVLRSVGDRRTFMDRLAKSVGKGDMVYGKPGGALWMATGASIMLSFYLLTCFFLYQISNCT